MKNSSGSLYPRMEEEWQKFQTMSSSTSPSIMETSKAYAVPMDALSRETYDDLVAKGRLYNPHGLAPPPTCSIKLDSYQEGTKRDTTSSGTPKGSNFRTNGTTLNPVTDIAFYLNQKKQVVTNVDPSVMLVDYIRDVGGCTGTKLSCGEGGCGACVVMLSYEDYEGNLVTVSCNACLRPLVSCDGMEVTTIEGIGSTSTQMDPIQSTLATNNGTQCGYCSPGMVMQMYSLLQSNSAPTSQQIENLFDGNICRCTGYRPILTSMQEFMDPNAPTPKLAHPLVPRVTGGKELYPSLIEFPSPKSTPAQAPYYQFVKGPQAARFRKGNLHIATDLHDNWRRKQDFVKRFPKELRGYRQRRLAERKDRQIKGGIQNTAQDDEPNFKTMRGNGSITDSGDESVLFYTAYTLDDVFDVLDAFKEDAEKTVKVIAGNTSIGVSKYFPSTTAIPSHPDVILNIEPVKELYGLTSDDNGVTLGANTSINDCMTYLQSVIDSVGNANKTNVYATIIEHLQLVAHTSVRNMGTIGGNIMLCQWTLDFPSDIYVCLTGANATVTINDSSSNQTTLSFSDFIGYDMTNKILASISIPFGLDTSGESQLYWTYKAMERHQNSKPLVNCAFSTILTSSSSGSLDAPTIVKEQPILAYGGVASTIMRASNTEAYLVGKDITDSDTLSGALQALSQECIPNSLPGHVAYRTSLVLTLFYKYFLALQPAGTVSASLESAFASFDRPISSGVQSYSTDPNEFPVSEAIPKLEAYEQCCGQSKYTQDLPRMTKEYFAAFVTTTQANATISAIDTTKALDMPGVLGYVGVEDIPGPNSFSSDPTVPANVQQTIFLDVGDTCVYHGQSIGVIVADTQAHANAAAAKVEVTYENVNDSPILTIDEAVKNNQFYDFDSFGPISVGDLDEGWANSDHIIQDTVSVGGQYHFYMETQNCTIIPSDNGSYLVYASTQWPANAQQIIAQALDITQNKVSVTVKRLGGAYGGKITQNLLPETACAVAAKKFGFPVSTQLDINTNMAMLGKRAPYQCTYKVGFTKEGVLQALKYTVYADGGSQMAFNAPANSAPILLAIDGVYYCPNWEATCQAVQTNTPGTTACRAPGMLPGLLFAEQVMEHVAQYLNMDPDQVKAANFYTASQVTPYGQPLTYFDIPEIWSQLQASCDYTNRLAQVNAFNEANTWVKQGISLVPTKYGLGWAGAMYGVLINVLVDGSIQISHAGIEVGQGINTKVAQMAAYCLKNYGVLLDQIQIIPTATDKMPNAEATGGSVTSEICCMVTQKACDELIERLKPSLAALKAKQSSVSWVDLVTTAYGNGVNLQVDGWVDPGGSDPFTYNSYCVACSQVQVDILSGKVEILRTDILFDCGISLNPALDVGQVEGAFVMGIGYYLTEAISYDETGEMMDNGTWNYKPPCSQDIPIVFNVSLLKNAPNPVGLLGSKASGEPPMSSSASVFFAIKHAIDAYRSQAGMDPTYVISPPLSVNAIQQACGITAEQLLM